MIDIPVADAGFERPIKLVEKARSDLEIPFFPGVNSGGVSASSREAMNAFCIIAYGVRGWDGRW